MKPTTIYLEAESLTTSGQGVVYSAWEDATESSFEGFPMLYSPSLIAGLNSLDGREDVSIVWFNDDRRSADFLQSNGLRSMSWRSVERTAPKGSKKLSKSTDEYWWKLDAFKADIFTHPLKRLIWADSTLEGHTDAVDNWLDPYGVLEDDRLYLHPSPLLTSEHLESMKEFILG